MVGRQLLVVRQQLRVAAVERFVQALPGGLVILATHQGDHLAVDKVHSLQPLQGQVAAKKAGRARQQHRTDLGVGSWQVRGGRQRGGVDELVEREVAGVHLGGAAAVHGGKGGPLGALPLGLDVVGDGLQVAGRADDDAHRYVDVKDLVQQIAERQRRQRISA